MRTTVDLPFRSIGDPHHGFEGQRAVRRGQLVHVVDFAVGRLASVEWRAIPGRFSSSV